MLKNAAELGLERCPHCNVARPRLQRVHYHETANHKGGNPRVWSLYDCGTCGGVVMTVAFKGDAAVQTAWPSATTVSDMVPARAKNYLEQAISSLHAPAGAVMLTGSAVDAMLKDKGYKSGTLNARIDQAAQDHLITAEMAAWAHEIRLDANDQRHSDENAVLPTIEDANKVIEFAGALAQFLYVLPARVARGRKSPTPSSP